MQALPEKERYTGKNDSEREGWSGMYPWQRHWSMVFFREVYDDCKERQMDSLWGLPLCSCGPFFQKTITEMHTSVSVLLRVWLRGGLGFDFESMCSLYPLSVRGSLWHKSTYTFMPLFPLQSLKSRRELTKSKLLPKAIKEMFLISQSGGAIEQPEPTKNNEWALTVPPLTQQTKTIYYITIQFHYIWSKTATNLYSK